MSVHRFHDEGVTEFRLFVQAPQPVPAPGAMVLCPMMGFVGAPSLSAVRDIYELAYRQAQAALSPPWHERALLASRN
jgi:hypothetical protein